MCLVNVDCDVLVVGPAVIADPCHEEISVGVRHAITTLRVSVKKRLASLLTFLAEFRKSVREKVIRQKGIVAARTDEGPYSHFLRPFLAPRSEFRHDCHVMGITIAYVGQNEPLVRIVREDSPVSRSRFRDFLRGRLFFRSLVLWLNLGIRHLSLPVNYRYDSADDRGEDGHGNHADDPLNVHRFPFLRSDSCLATPSV